MLRKIFTNPVTHVEACTQAENHSIASGLCMHINGSLQSINIKFNNTTEDMSNQIISSVSNRIAQLGCGAYLEN